MPNRLANENSPYLIQHAENPVDWYPWGEEALEKSRKENKPVFLSIGYAACHWCHVMERESFEDEDTAAIMNEHFVNVKVDREERPDLDNIYMKAVVAMTGQGGWPMSVFLTPEGEPFYGGTYFPPIRRYNMSSFREVLQGVATSWERDRERIFRAGKQLIGHLGSGFSLRRGQQSLEEGSLEKASMALAQSYDWKNGGWGSAPKFPQPMSIEFLIRRATRGDKFALKMATHALDAMAKGGMYDVVGGGFARYSVDDGWLVPHFEKMLYDNAQLALVYLHAYLLTGNKAYRRVVEETLDFVVREMTHPKGGFYSSLDADSEGEEGKYYVWTPEEIREAVGAGVEVELVFAAYHVTEGGNYEGHMVLQRVLDDEELGGKFGIPPLEIPERLRVIHKQMLEYREKRIRPGTDDKVLVSWNALMLVVFSEAAKYLGRLEYLGPAIRNANFLLRELYQDERLLRSWRNDTAHHNGYLEDYASLSLALLSLYQSDPNPRWFVMAQKLVDELVSNFKDSDGGFFDTRDDHEKLVIRPKELKDNAIPSGNALAVLALLQIAAYTGNGGWRDLAVEMLVELQIVMVGYPGVFAQWLCALDFAIGPVREIAILGNSQDPEYQALVDQIWKRYRPRTIVASSNHPPHPTAPPLLTDRPLLNEKPTVYVCERFVCQQPVTNTKDLAEQLER